MTNPFADIAPDDTPAASAATATAAPRAPQAARPYDPANPFGDIGMDDGEVNVDQSGKGDIERPKYSMLDTLLYQGAMGLNPFGNEIAGGIEGLIRGVKDPMNFATRFGEGYNDQMIRSKVVSERTTEDNPITANVAYFGGALASTPFGGRYVAAAKTLPRMAGRAALVGGAQQGVYEAGASDADTLAGRFDAAVDGAKTGALLGGGIPLAIAAVRGTGRLAGALARPADGLASSVLPGSAGRVAERRVGEALMRDMKSERVQVDKIYQQDLADAMGQGRRIDEDVKRALWDGAVQKLRDANPRLSPGEFADARAAGQSPIAADIGGENIADLARKAAAADPTAAATLKGASVARSKGVAGRMKDFTSRFVLPEFAGDDATVADTLSRLKDAARAQNAHRYAAAEAHPNAQAMWTGRLAELSDAPAVWTAMQDAVRRSGNVAVGRSQGRVFSPFGLDDAGNVVIKNPDVAPNLAFWDVVKQTLDDDVNSLYAAGRGRQAKEVEGLRDMLRDELDTLVPDYKSARSGAAAAFGAADALDAGRRFASNMDSMKTSTLQQSLSEMTDAERKLASHGFVEELIQRVRNNGDIAFLDRPGMREKINLMSGGPANGQSLSNFLFRERVIKNFAKLAEGDPALASKGGDGWLSESLMGTLVTSVLTGDGFGAGDVAGGFGVALGRRAAGRYARKGDARIHREIVEILTENDPARLQKLLARATKSGETSSALKRLAALSDRFAAAGVRVGAAEQQAVERIEPQLGYIDAQPGYARGGSVKLARPLPDIVVVGAGPDIEDLVPKRRKAFAEGGHVRAVPQNNAARDAYLGVEGSTGSQPDKTAYDHKGRHTHKLNMRGPTAVASANSRRNTVSDSSRQRIRPERLRAVAPAVDPRQFWRDLQQAMTDHAMQRGLDVSGVQWPAFDDPQPADVAVAAPPVETPEAALEPRRQMPPKAPLDPVIARNAAKRRAKRIAEGKPHEPLP